jgi:hypothetical protein
VSGTDLLSLDVPNTAGTSGVRGGLVVIDYMSSRGGPSLKQNAAALVELEADLADAALALARLVSDTGQRVELDDLIAELGFSVDDLRADPSYISE